MAVVERRMKGADVQCGKEAPYVTRLQRYPLCGEHVLEAKREGVTFDAGTHRVSFMAGVEIEDR